MLLLGIDGGGTETKCLLTDENGHVISYLRGGPSNPNGQSAQSAKNNFVQTAKNTVKDCREDIAVFAGIAGCSDTKNADMLRNALEAELPHCRVIVTSDTVNALSAGVGPGEDGMIAICGTGSSFFSRENGALKRTGGWGYLFGDEGSGYAIGREAVMEAMKEADGFSADEILVSKVNAKMGKPVAEALPELYAMGRTGIASFAICVAEAANEGSERAARIIRENAESAASMIKMAQSKCKKACLPVVTAGSIWIKMPCFTDIVREACRDTWFITDASAPVIGSVYEAAKMCGIITDSAFKRNIEREYKR